MDVVEAIKQRYSVRSYRDDPVDEHTVNELMEAARLAPSASNRQEWRFVVVRDADTRQKLCKAASGQQFVAEAPVVIACCAQSDGHVMACGHPCFLIDVAIAIDHITLRAVELGLGTCWIGAFDQPKVKDILGIPKEIEVVQLLTVGHPADAWREKHRLDMNELVRFESWA